MRPQITAIMQSGNLYVYCMGNPIRYVDETGQMFLIVTGAVGAVLGGIGGAIYSEIKYGEVRWENVVAGAAIGGAVGLTGGAIASSIIAGSATASTGAVLTGAGVVEGVTVSAETGIVVYKSIEEGVNFTNTTLQRMSDPSRYVSIQVLIDAIKYGTPVPDPQGTSAIMYTIDIMKNGKPYTLEVLYDEVTNTILHFLYYR